MCTEISGAAATPRDRRRSAGVTSQTADRHRGAGGRVAKTTQVVTVGGIQSNHCRATAAAARRVGLEPHVVLRTAAPRDDPGLEGNLLVDRAVGATLHLVGEAVFAERGGAGLVDDVAGPRGRFAMRRVLTVAAASSGQGRGGAVGTNKAAAAPWGKQGRGGGDHKAAAAP